MTRKVLASITAIFGVLFIPFHTVLAAGGESGASEAASSGDWGMTTILLLILSVATLVTMAYLLITDNG